MQQHNHIHSHLSPLPLLPAPPLSTTLLSFCYCFFRRDYPAVPVSQLPSPSLSCDHCPKLSPFQGSKQWPATSRVPSFLSLHSEEMTDSLVERVCFLELSWALDYTSSMNQCLIKWCFWPKPCGGIRFYTDQELWREMWPTVKTGVVSKRRVDMDQKL